MRPMTGILLIAIGVLHTVVGIFTGYRVLSQISKAAFATETGRQLVTSLGREFAFWFLFGGLLMMVLGHLLIWIERQLGRPVPAFLGWELLALSAAGLLFMPVSGFWLVLAVAVYAIVTARRFKGMAGTSV
jgi:hypothetical protein